MCSAGNPSCTNTPTPCPCGSLCACQCVCTGLPVLVVQLVPGGCTCPPGTCQGTCTTANGV